MRSAAETVSGLPRDIVTRPAQLQTKERSFRTKSRVKLLIRSGLISSPTGDLPDMSHVKQCNADLEVGFSF